MFKAYKYRIYPNASQRELMGKHFGCVRHVYNWGLELRKKHYEETGEGLSYFATSKLLTQYKQEKDWLKEVNSQSLISSLRNLDTAYKNFFKGHAQFPKFKSKYAPWQSFQCPQKVGVDFEAGIIKLLKIKQVKAKFHREFEGKIKTVTIKRSPSGKYYASVLVDDGKQAPTPTTIVPEQTIGIDVGLSHMLITSEGEKVANPMHLKQRQERLAAAQKQFARRKKGSNNRIKQRLKVAVIHEKVANSRLDYIHKVTRKLVDKSHATSYAIEDLNVLGMLKNRKLSKAIADVSWGTFVSCLEHKSEWAGKNVLRIGRFQPSSKTCNGCGYKMESMPLHIRVWTCPGCGANHDRDVNAARNIKDIGLADALRHSVCVKSSSMPMPVSAGAMAKGAGLVQLGSQVVQSK